MAIFRRGRFYWRLIRELSAKYTVALIFGFILGIIGSLTILRILPTVTKIWFSPVARIGVIGDFTPSTLPLSVQEEISFGLTILAPDGTAGPGLASSWETSDGGKHYVFHLRSDRLWHNGKPVESKDINYNIRDVLFSAIDNHTLSVTLKEPFSPFPTLVAKPIFGPGLRGFGPYRVASIKLKAEAVSSITLIPFSDPKKLAKEYRFYRTEAQAITAYKLGDIDRIEDLADVSDLTSWGKTAIIPKTRYDRMVTLFFNGKDSRFTEKNFRLALAYSMPDFKQERAYSPIAKTSWAYSDNVRHFNHDPQVAQKLLKNSAVASDSGSLMISTFSPYLDVAQAIAKSWSQIGMSAGVTVINDLSSGYQILLTAQNIPPDPDQYPFWHSTQDSTNITHYVNVKIDKLLEDGRKESDVEARKKIYADFAKRLVDDAPAVFLYYPTTYTVERKK